MRYRVWWIIATIVVVFSLLAVAFSTVAQDAYRYDTNGNNRIDDEELLVAVDDWIARIINDAEFFAILDLWAVDGYVIRGIPSSNQDCPLFTELVALRNGLTFGSSLNAITGQAASDPIDIAFEEAIYLPTGTSVSVTVKSLSTGLTATDATLRSPMPNTNFSNGGNGTYTVSFNMQSGNNFPALHEWMSFTPNWSNSAVKGTLRVETVIQAPHCGRMETNISVHLVKSSSGNNNPPTDPNCPSGTRLMGLRAGVPLGTTSNSVHAAGFTTTPIDIAFRQNTVLPQGTTIQFHVESSVSGLEPRNGQLTSPFTSSSFHTNGPMHIIGNGSVTNTTTVQAQYEWAKFTPYWELNTNSGEFNVRAVLNAPGCAQVVELTTKITMTKTQNPSTPPANDPNCPTRTSLVGMRGGVPMGSSGGGVYTASLTRPIDIAFRDPTFLPQGTSIEFNVTSDTPGMEPWNGEFMSPISSGGFFTSNPLHLVGNGSAPNAVNIPALHEWARFTPYWDEIADSGKFTVRVLINAPGCTQMELTRNFQMRKITTADENRIQVTQTRHAVAFEMNSNNPIQLEIWTLSGTQVFKSDFSDRVVLMRGAGETQLANGVYIYLVRERNAAGAVVSQKLKKLILMR